MPKIDKLALLRGKPYVVNDYISISQPSIEEIAEYGNNRYLVLISTLTGTSYDFRFQLDDVGIDYEKIEDFTMFCMIFPTLSIDETSILFGDKFDPQSFSIKLDEENDYFFLINEEGVKIDQVIYQIIVDYLREVHGLKRNFIHFGNEMARQFHMKEEREQLEKQKDEATAWLEPLVSAMVNCGNFKYSYEDVWRLTFYQFMDSVKRIQKINEYQNLSMGIYTGNIDVEKMGQTKIKQQLNWLGEL